MQNKPWISWERELDYVYVYVAILHPGTKL